MPVPRHVALPAIACLPALGTAGCSSDALSFVPNMDHGSSGRANKGLQRIRHAFRKTGS